MPSVQNLADKTRVNQDGTPNPQGAYFVRELSSGRKIIASSSRYSSGESEDVNCIQGDIQVVTTGNPNGFRLGQLVTRTSDGVGWQLADASISGDIAFGFVAESSAKGYTIRMAGGPVAWPDHGLQANAVHYVGKFGALTTDPTNMAFTQPAVLVLSAEKVQYLHWPPSNSTDIDGIFDNTFDPTFS